MEIANVPSAPVDQDRAKPAATAEKRSVGMLIFFITMALVFLMAARMPIDTDLWWHLKAGEVTIQQGKPLLVDVFSYTKAGSTWLNHSWLAEVLLYLLFRWGGFFALGMGVAATAVLSMGLVYFAMDGPHILRSFLQIFAAVVAAWVWTPRPEIFSLACLAGIILILNTCEKGQRKWFWLLIPIFILWSNLHAGYVLGFIYIGAYLVGLGWDWLFGNHQDTNAVKRSALVLVGWGAASGAAVLINPNGIATWLVPFRTVGMGAIQNLISEWASPDFHNIGQQAMLLLFFLGVLAFILARERIAGTVLIPYLVFAYMAFVARRNFGPFALVAAVGISRYFWLALQHVWGDLERRFPSLAAGLDEFIRKSQRKGLSAPARKAVNLLLVGGFAAFGIVKCYAVTSPIIMNAYLPQTFPVLAVDWIHRNQPPGRLFNSYDWGGYLIWSAPDYPVFVDGRTDLFTDKVISEWMQVVNAEPGWQEVLTRWNVHLVLLEPSRPVTKVLPSQGWREVYRDQQAVVFEK